MPKRNWKIGKKSSLIVVALLGAIAFGVLATQQFFSDDEATPRGTTPMPSGPAVTVAFPVVREITEWDEYTGRFEAIDNVEIRARVSGYLTDVVFEDGQIVQAGDLLFRIDPRPFEAALAAANAELAAAEAALSNARDEYTRGNELLERRAISQELLDARLRDLRIAEAERAAAEASVSSARLDLEFTEVRAPIAGRISDDFVSKGNLIVGGATGGTLLTTLVSINPIHFEFTASEAEYLKYVRLSAEGSRVSSRDTANPVRLRLMDETAFDHVGRMSFVDNQIDRSTGTMRGRATFENPDGVFAPGMFGRLRVSGSGRYQAILVPDSAVQTDQSEKFVWVASADDIALPASVELGPIVDGLRVVRNGLSPDSRVIVNGTQFVRPNSPVSPQETDAAPSADSDLR